MKMEQKLAAYLVERGIKHGWFAAKLGVSRQFLTQILKGERRMPEKYWTLVVVLTGGHISLKDFEDR